MIIALPILYTALFIWLISRVKFFRNSGLSFKTILFLFALKLIAGVGLTLVYTYYYTDKSTSDIYKYFDDGKVIYNVLKESPADYAKLVTGIGANDTTLTHYLDDTKNWHEQSGEWLDLINVKNFNYFNSNRLVTRFNAVVMIFSQGNIYVHVVFMCFLGLIGGIALYRALAQYYQQKEKLLLLLIFLLPGVLFWQSGVLKEGLLIFFTGLFIYNFFAVFNKPNYYLNVAVALVSLFFIVLCKYYVAIAMAPGIVAYTLWALTGKINAGYKFAYTFMVMMLAMVVILYAAPQYNPLNTLCDKRDEAIKSAIFGEAKEILFFDKVTPYPADVAAKIPEIIKLSFIEPMKVTPQPFILMATLENLLVLALLLLFIIYAQRRIEQPAVFWFLISYSLLMLFIIGFTTPVSGGLVRYKTAAIPFLLMAILMLCKPINWKYFNSAINTPPNVGGVAQIAGVV
ncbi:MAG: hypothetical protein M0D57_15085 [Sphingobacteriales bacterium JAD_PAG50586_3]|nr:MAG: hypothetical protein M0D57_15085 [Sphingobacteriales bacterium JAD_PAG50586_3]